MDTATDSARQSVLRVFEEGFNQGNLATVDELVASGGHDHQHPAESDLAAHVKDVIVAMRRAFPDLHFAVTEIIAEGDWVALHSVMTGTHQGPLGAPLSPREIPPTGRSIRVPHMHMIRLEHGQGAELLHLMDTFAMMGQLGLLPSPSTTGT